MSPLTIGLVVVAPVAVAAILCLWIIDRIPIIHARVWRDFPEPGWTCIQVTSAPLGDVMFHFNTTGESVRKRLRREYGRWCRIRIHEQ